MDDFVIVAVVLLNAIVGTVQEGKAKNSLARLRALTRHKALVRRDGGEELISAEDLVVGDILILHEGDRVSADGRIFKAEGLTVDESVLTGEAFTIAKTSSVLTRINLVIGDQKNMLFAGTVITMGRGKGIVTATGMETEFGKITGLVKEVKEPKTPLQLSMKQLSGWLVYLAVSLSAIIPLIGFIQGRPFKEMVLTGLGLAFATA